MPRPAIHLSSVSVCLASRRLLTDVSLDVHAGEIVGLLGPNGAGKTTLIRTAIGLIDPACGEVYVCGDHSRTRGRHVSYLPEERGLYMREPVRRTLELVATLRGLGTHEARIASAAWLNRFGLRETADRPLVELSKGQQQKIQLAAALLGERPVLVLDEPFAGLDPLAIREVVGVVREAREHGRAVLLSAHQLHVVEPLCDRVAIMSHGRIQLNGRLSDLRAQHLGSLEDILFAAVAEGGR
jgi:ABC-2 type transport system ATP-binding protein